MHLQHTKNFKTILGIIHWNPEREHYWLKNLLQLSSSTNDVQLPYR